MNEKLEKKLKGRVVIYDPEIKDIKEIVIEDNIIISWTSDEKAYGYFAVVGNCPYDGKEIVLDIMFSDWEAEQYPYHEPFPASDCIHFWPSKFLSNEEIDSMKLREKINKVEMGFIYVNMKMEDFAQKMKWKVDWDKDDAGKEYPYFVIPAEE